MTEKKVLKYTKNTILNSNLDYNKDLLSVLLEDNKEYSKEDIDKIVSSFNKKAVK